MIIYQFFLFAEAKDNFKTRFLLNIIKDYDNHNMLSIMPNI